MIRSMTGYGMAEQTFDDKTISVEIKSVNNRYFDCSVRCPRLCSFAEEPVKACLRENGVSRGKLDVSLGVTFAGGDVAVTLNENLLKAYLGALGKLTTSYGLTDDISAMSVAATYVSAAAESICFAP